MKRFILILALLSVGATAWGVATLVIVNHRNVGSVTVDTQWEDTTWTRGDSIRVLQAGDSSTTTFRAVGEVVLMPGQEIRCGWGTHKSGKRPTLDTCIFTNPSFQGNRAQRVPFVCEYTRSDTVAYLDTLYFFISQNQSSVNAFVYNLHLTATSGCPTINDAF